MFEAGALAKGLSTSRICTLLIDLETTDVGNPLAQFNHTKLNKEGIYELIRTLNSALNEKSLSEKVLEQVFNTYWPQFEQGLQDTLAKEPVSDNASSRTNESMVAEILQTVRSLDKRTRKLDNSNVELFGNGIDTPPDQLEKRVKAMVKEGIPTQFIIEHYRGIEPLDEVHKYIINSDIQ